MFYPLINKETKKIQGFTTSDVEIVAVDMDSLPVAEAKQGIDHVMYLDPQTQKIVLREEERPLTEAEQAAKKQAELESQVINLMEALAEIHEGGGA